ncbi:CoA ester lyase [Cupriavidus sp. AU9028]|uniref:HpcH/HpaI aldolase/citrate lyase family protein n=1 Tax=Cupriavidus sp. AU9028 TaxID=2871157 RepID=UPI001C95195B|nr:CoA ester lyase [Cupriavidus sp. AU9028]MBY4896897.1 CoA ester lyase [Cupriavidus sp. AU9028]
MTGATLPRSYLFVPADRPERFAKAHASGADMVILDLEDAVAPADKERARALLDDYLAAGGSGMVRVNGTQTRWFEDDLRVCRHPGVHGVILPKAEAKEQIAQTRARLPERAALLPLIETAAGMTRAAEVAAAPGVQRLVFGTVDFRTELAIEGDDLELLTFRSLLVLASRTAGIGAPVDGVTVAIADVEELRAASWRGRRLGFGAKLCIHPSQVPHVNDAYRPAPAQLAWARRVLEQARVESGAFQLDGEMVDAPVIARARALLEQVGERGSA